LSEAEASASPDARSSSLSGPFIQKLEDGFAYPLSSASIDQRACSIPHRQERLSIREKFLDGRSYEQGIDRATVTQPASGARRPEFLTNRELVVGGGGEDHGQPKASALELHRAGAEDRKVTVGEPRRKFGRVAPDPGWEIVQPTCVAGSNDDVQAPRSVGKDA
jgi:hypothetical protein